MMNRETDDESEKQIWKEIFDMKKFVVDKYGCKESVASVKARIAEESKEYSYAEELEIAKKASIHIPGIIADGVWNHKFYGYKKKSIYVNGNKIMLTKEEEEELVEYNKKLKAALLDIDAIKAKFAGKKFIGNEFFEALDECGLFLSWEDEENPSVRIYGLKRLPVMYWAHARVAMQYKKQVLRKENGCAYAQYSVLDVHVE